MLTDQEAVMDMNKTDLRPGRVVRVLLVEDNPADALLFSRALDRLETATELQVVTNAEEALHLLEADDSGSPTFRPDIAFLDFNLPGLRGVDLISIARRVDHLSTIPMLILTSSEAEQDLQAAIRAGASGYLVKPVLLRDLYHLVERVEAEWLRNLSTSGWHTRAN